MADLFKQPPAKVVTFLFRGGVRDGQVVRSDQPQGGVNEADAYWTLSWKGTVGRRFDVSAPGSLTCHRYQVRGKYEVGDEIHVTCDHVG